MLNQVVLVGRLTKDIELKTAENGKKYANLSIAVHRPYKNEATNEYETDFINITIFEKVAENTAEYCKKGDIVGVKGSLRSNSFEREDGTKEYRLEAVGERVTFLTTKSKDTPERE